MCNNNWLPMEFILTNLAYDQVVNQMIVQIVFRLIKNQRLITECKKIIQ